MRDSVCLPVADYNIGIFLKYRCAESGNFMTAVLIVSVGIDDDIGTELQACINAGSEGPRKTLVAFMANDVVGPALAGNLGRTVGTAIVDDEDFNDIDTLDMFRNVREGCRQRGFFIEAGYLDDQFHVMWPLSFAT